MLDLYAGTGAMGIEALSRGAEHAVFVDRAYQASAAIHDNLDRTRLADRATVVTQDVSAFVAHAPETDGPFDLVLLDPPYDVATAELEGVLAGLGPDGALRPGMDGGPDEGRSRVPRLSFQYTGPSRGSSATATASSSCTGRFRWA